MALPRQLLPHSDSISSRDAGRCTLTFCLMSWSLSQALL
jgi:hypothetical protein